MRAGNSAATCSLVDEVQTGMYRTGPFTLSAALGLTPDLLVRRQGDLRHDVPVRPDAVLRGGPSDSSTAPAPDLPAAIRQRYGYEFGYKTVLNVLRQAEQAQPGRQRGRIRRAVRPAAARRTGVLQGGARRARLRAADRHRAGRIALAAALVPETAVLVLSVRHAAAPAFPVLVGFCQYEPNVLKITPPLTIAADEIRQMCATIGDVLRRPFYRLLLASVLGGMLGPFRWGRNQT